MASINIKNAVIANLEYVIGLVGGKLRRVQVTDIEADTDDFFRQESDGSTRGVPAATAAQGLTSSNAENPLVPSSIAGLLGKGTDIASAGTIVLPDNGNYFHITGTTTITDIDYTTGGRLVWVDFEGVLTLTHHATTLILPTGANITTAAGDNALFALESGDNVRCLSYQRKDGTALVGGATTASTTDALTGTDSSKSVTSDALAALWEQGSNVASASTVSLGEGGYFHITGTTTITDIDFATDKAGRKAVLVFDGALTLTHNASTLILPTGANITTAAGDCAIIESEGSDVIRVVAYMRASGLPLAPTYAIGIERVYIPAGYMRPAITSGAAYGVTNAGSNQPDYQTLDFDTASDEYAWFDWRMPERWNAGTVKFMSVWTAASGSGTAAFGLAGVALADNEALATALGTAQTSSDTLQNATRVHIGPLSSAITIGSSPAAGDVIYFRVNRDTANDSLGVDAKLIGIILEYTITALKDA